MLNNNKVEAIQNVLGLIATQNSENKYLTFSNADNKFWILPKKNIRTALNIYQPSSIKGKLLKFFLPYFKNSIIIQKILKTTTNHYSLDSRLLELLKSIFKIENIEFSIFGGTPSNHQKITIQVFNGTNILGYCKISDNKEVKNLFKYEQKILNQLKKSGIKQIPDCLYCGNLQGEVDVFLQSTIKTNNSKIWHQWKIEHWHFLTELNQKSEKKITFEQTDYFKTLQLLEKNSAYLSLLDQETIIKATTKVVNFYKDKIVYFSAYHSDFTPWNMFTEKGELFVFDFEYAKMTYPPYLDYFHFFTQTCIFEKQWNEKKIYNDHCKQRENIEKHINTPNFYYLCYLLDVVSLYINRDKGSYSKDVERNISIWIKLISQL